MFAGKWIVVLAVALVTPAQAGSVYLTGPLGQAEVRIFAYPQVQVPVLKTSTSVGDDLLGTGHFDVPGGSLRPDALYLVDVRNGRDYDADADGTMDQEPSPNSGHLHAVARGSELMVDSFNVNLVTDIAFRRVSYQMAARLPSWRIQKELDQRAPLILRADVNGDGRLDRFDYGAWTPSHEPAVALSSTQLRRLASSLSAGAVPLDELLQGSDNLLGTAEYPHGQCPQIVAWAISGDRLYLAYRHDVCAGSEARVAVFDITDPRSPALLAAPPLGSGLDAAAFTGQALVYSSNGEVLALDLSDPNQARITSRIPGHGSDETAMVVSGKRIYVADRQCGFRVISLNAGLLEEVRACGPDVPDSPLDVTFLKHRNGLYISDAVGMQVWDVDGHRIGRLDIGDHVRSAVIAGGRLWAVTFAGTSEYDLADPLHPRLLAHHNAVSASIVAGGLLVLDNQLRVLNISQPGHPTVRRNVPGPRQRPPIASLPASSIVWMLGAGAITSVETRHAVLPSIEAAIPLSAPGYDIAAIGTDLYICQAAQLEVATLGPGPDVSLGLRGTLALNAKSGSCRIKVSANLGYFSDRNTIFVIDLSDPDHPLLASQFHYKRNTDISADIADYALSAGRLYVVGRRWFTGGLAEGNGEIAAYDVSVPSAPVFLGATALPAPRGIAADGTRLVVADNTVGIYTIDASDPTHLQVAGQTSDPIIGNPYDDRNVSISHNTVHVTVRDEGVRSYDITDYTSPVPRPMVRALTGGSAYLDDIGRSYSLSNPWISVVDEAADGPFVRYVCDTPLKRAVRIGPHLVGLGYDELRVIKAVATDLPGTTPR